MDKDADTPKNLKINKPIIEQNHPTKNIHSKMDKEYKEYNLHDRERIVQMRSSRGVEQNIYNLTFFFFQLILFPMI